MSLKLYSYFEIDVNCPTHLVYSSYILIKRKKLILITLNAHSLFTYKVFLRSIIRTSMQRIIYGLVRLCEFFLVTDSASRQLLVK